MRSSGGSRRLGLGDVFVEAHGRHLAGGVAVGGSRAPKDLLGDGAELDRHALGARQIDCQPEVLAGEGHGEAALVVAVVQQRQQVALEQHAVGGTGHEGLMEHRQVDPGARPDRERLGDGDERIEPQLVEQELDGVAGAVGADVHDLPGVAHDGKDGPHLLEVARLAAHVDLQGAGRGAFGHAGDGRVEHPDAAPRAALAHTLGDGRQRGRHIDPQGAARQGGERLAGAQHDVVDRGRGGQHGD